MAFKFVYHNVLLFQIIVGLDFLRLSILFHCVHEEGFTQHPWLRVKAVLAARAELSFFFRPVSEEAPVDPETSPP